jgi:hypothetical protein
VNKRTFEDLVNCCDKTLHNVVHNSIYQVLEYNLIGQSDIYVIFDSNIGFVVKQNDKVLLEIPAK